MSEWDEKQEALKQAIEIVLRSGADFEFKREALAALVAGEAATLRAELEQLRQQRDEAIGQRALAVAMAQADCEELQTRGLDEAAAERQRILALLAAARDELEQTGFAQPFKDGLLLGIEEAIARIAGTESELDGRA